MLMPAIRAISGPYPCRCLCRGFWQITSTAPWRRITLHFSHMGLTEARTFIAPRVYRLQEKERRTQETVQRRPKRVAGRRQLLGPSAWLLGRSAGLFQVPGGA